MHFCAPVMGLCNNYVVLGTLRYVCHMRRTEDMQGWGPHNQASHLMSFLSLTLRRVTGKKVEWVYMLRCRYDVPA